MSDEEPPRKKTRLTATQADENRTIAKSDIDSHEMGDDSESAAGLEAAVNDTSSTKEDHDEGGDVASRHEVGKGEGEDETQGLYVVFCTAEIPPKVIDLLLQAIAEDDDDFTPLYILESTGPHQRKENPHPRRAKMPFSFAEESPKYPFLNWKPAACYEFYTANLCAPGDTVGPARFASSVFLILDSTTLSDMNSATETPSFDKVTYLLCTDGPDMPDGEDDPVELKGRRRHFSNACTDLVQMELGNASICEVGGDEEEYPVFVYPPESLGRIEGAEADGGMVYSKDTAKDVRAKVRKAKGDEYSDGSEDDEIDEDGSHHGGHGHPDEHKDKDEDE